LPAEFVGDRDRSDPVEGVVREADARRHRESEHDGLAVRQLRIVPEERVDGPCELLLCCGGRVVE
jgi:hypothetical protein